MYMTRTTLSVIGVQLRVGQKPVETLSVGQKHTTGKKHSIDLMLNGWAEVDLYLEGLKYKFNVGLNKYTNRNYTYIAPYYFSSAGQNLKTQLDEKYRLAKRMVD